MASSTATFSIPWLAEFYHDFPHRDFNFVQTTTVFSPDDESYQQSLIMWGILPAVIGTLSFILFSGYYLCCSMYFCSNCSAPAPKSRPSLKKCLRYWMVISATLCCGAVIMGFTANDMTSEGVNQFSSDVQDINSSIEGVRKQIAGIDADVDSTKKALTSFVSIVPFAQPLALKLRTSLNGLKKPLSSIDKKMSLGTSTLTELVNQILMYNHYRWWSTWGLFCLNSIICITVIYAAVKKSKCGFILMTLFSLFAILLNWAFIGIELSGSVGAGDLCSNPKSALNEITTNNVQKEVIHYYLVCENVAAQNPLHKELVSAETTLNTSLKILNDPMFNVFPPAAKEPVTQMRKLLNDADLRMAKIEDILQCHRLHQDYVDALDAVCNKVLDGLSLLLLAGLIITFFFGLLLCLVVPIWKYVPRLRPILRKNVYLTTSSYEGPPGEDRHDDTPYHSAVEESIDEAKGEHVPLLKKNPDYPPAYDGVSQSNSDLQFFSLEEDRVRRGRFKGGRSKGAEVSKF